MKKKKRMFDYFEISEAKEVSEEDCKELKKRYKKSDAITIIKPKKKVK